MVPVTFSFNSTQALGWQVTEDCILTGALFKSTTAGTHTISENINLSGATVNSGTLLRFDCYAAVTSVANTTFYLPLKIPLLKDSTLYVFGGTTTTVVICYFDSAVNLPD